MTLVWVLVLTIHGYGKLAVSNMGEFGSLKQCEEFGKTVQLEIEDKFKSMTVDTVCLPIKL